MFTHQRANATATGPLAFHAVTQHMIDRNLPAPISIALPASRDAIEIHVIWETDVSEWLATLDIDHETRRSINGNLHITFSGRLPDSGFRITVTTVNLGAGVLTVVPS